MSLINEALKKAQAQRQGGSPATPPPSTGDAPPPPASVSPTSRDSSGPNLWMILGILAVIAVIFAGAAGLVVWGLMSQKNAEPVAQTATPAAETPAPASNPQPGPPSDNAEAETTKPIEFKVEPLSGDDIKALEAVKEEPKEPVETEPVAAPAAPEPLSAKPAPEKPAKVAASPKAAPTPAKEPPPTVARKAEIPPVEGQPAEKPEAPAATGPDPAVEAFLAQLEVRGVMSGGKKVLIFNQSTARSSAYQAGATVNNELQIKIVNITEQSISFVDHVGFVYTKRF